MVLLEQYPDAKKEAEKASFLVKVRRLVVAAAQMPSYLVRSSGTSDAATLPESECHSDEEKKGHKVLALLCQLGGGGGVPDVVLDYVMPSWTPLRKHSRFAKQLVVPGLKKT